MKETNTQTTEKNKTLEQLKILCIGNSFSVDTMEHVANIALNSGIKNVKLGNLYIGGCSINKHYHNIENDIPAYKYYLNTGTEWTSLPEYRISDAVKSEMWDWISIQHGTGDGSRYTLVESYAKLAGLVEHVKSLAWQGVKINFNMTWVGEPYYNHPEIVAYGGNQLLIYAKIAEIMQNVIVPMKEIDFVSPTGTAIQNARTSKLKTLSRDGYHLSLDIGRYIAGLAFFKALTGLDIDRITWAPEGVDNTAVKIAIESANNAIKVPFAVTPSEIV